MTPATPARWTRLWSRVAGPSAAPPPFAALAEAYSQPHRHYHNLHHISECLAELDSVQPKPHDAIAVELAIWFHDAVYDPRRQDNEAQSAELARRSILTAGGPTNLGDKVAALVRATRTHDPGQDPDAALMVDVDLSILGKPQERFLEYEHQIRREYEWVPPEVFAAKRAEILRCFLARPRIYLTEPFYSRYERQARQNLQTSVASLSG